MAKMEIPLEIYEMVGMEPPKEEEKAPDQGYTLIKDTSPSISATRSDDEENENKMNVFLSEKVFPAMKEAGIIKDFKFGNSEQDKHGTDVILYFNDGSELKVDNKARWSKMNDPQNDLIPIEFQTNNRNGERIDGWMLDMSEIETENHKQTQALNSILPAKVTRTEGDTEVPVKRAKDARAEDIKAIRGYFIPTEKYLAAVKEKTGYDATGLKNKALETEANYNSSIAEGEKPRLTNREGFEKMNAFMYYSVNYPEQPTCLLTPERFMTQQAGAIKYTYDVNEGLKVYGDKQLIDLLKEDAPKEHEKPIENLADMKNQAKNVSFNSKDMLEKGPKTKDD